MERGRRDEEEGWGRRGERRCGSGRGGPMPEWEGGPHRGERGGQGRGEEGQSASPPRSLDPQGVSGFTRFHRACVGVGAISIPRTLPARLIKAGQHRWTPSPVHPSSAGQVRETRSPTNAGQVRVIAPYCLIKIQRARRGRSRNEESPRTHTHTHTHTHTQPQP